MLAACLPTYFTFYKIQTLFFYVNAFTRIKTKIFCFLNATMRQPRDFSSKGTAIPIVCPLGPAECRGPIRLAESDITGHPSIAQQKLDTTSMGEMPLILAVETSGRWGSVAIGKGDELLAERPFSSPMRHSAELFPAITALLAEAHHGPADVAEVYVSSGPGSFTGLRLAVTLAKTMALANGTKIVAVNSLEAAAQNATDYSRETGTPCQCVAVVLDAKRGQFFAGFFRPAAGRWQAVGSPQLMKAEAFLAMAEEQGLTVHLLGEGLVYYAAQFSSPHIAILPEKFWQPKAAAVFVLGREQSRAGNFADPISLVPTYIRKALDEDSPPKKKPL
jgi:tRNA threonylcarbamoyladenosine biosynthesis protein TsaB